MSSRDIRSYLECRFDRIDKGRAVLVFEDNQELLISRRSLPNGVVAGQELEIHIHTPGSANQHRKELARAILQEILNG